MITPIKGYYADKKEITNYWFNSLTRTVYRVNIDERKHLYRKFGSVPCFNYKLFLDYKTKAIKFGAKSDKTKWTISTKDLEEHGEVINHDESQISLDLFFGKWKIEDIVAELPLVDKLPKKTRKKRSKKGDNFDPMGLIV